MSGLSQCVLVIPCVEISSSHFFASHPDSQKTNMANLFWNSLVATLVLATLFSTVASRPSMDSMPNSNHTLNSAITSDSNSTSNNDASQADNSESNIIGAKCTQHHHCADISYCNIKMDAEAGQCAMAWWFIMLLVMLSPFILIVGGLILLAIFGVLFFIGVGIYMGVQQCIN